ncbi:hypothetical protein OHU34_43315 [Streptomyces sp. NBC_00080]|uniref:NACHT domain-containing protein n=1 Tax=Streptomyces sp. NBC_00080 TaxID=2975645 RepID=UPI003253E8AC
MLDQADGEERPADEFFAGATREISGNTFHASAAIQQGDRGIQVNVFPDAPEDARNRERWLAQYLAAAAETSKEHPYPAMLPSAGPSLDDVYVRQRLGSLAQDGFPVEGDAIDRILGSTQMCTVLAGAGGGKSSLLRTLLAVGVDRWRQDPDQGVVPVLVPAAALDGQPLDTALAGVVRSGLKGLVETLPPALFLEPPTPRACWLVLVDELDEIADPIRRWRVLRHLRSVEENPDRPHYRFVIATRPLPESELDLLGAAVGSYELERFQLAELADVARRWFAAYGLGDPDRLAQLFVGDLERSHLAGLARIPLMASLLCQLYAATPGQPLPAVRGAIYAEFARMLHKRQYNPAEPGNPRTVHRVPALRRRGRRLCRTHPGPAAAAHRLPRGRAAQGQLRLGARQMSSWPNHAVRRRGATLMKAAQGRGPRPCERAATSGPSTGGLVRSRRAIVAARGRNAIPSDGGGTGKSDGND